MNERSPFHFALRLLHAFCPPHLLEEIEGDLLQKFERDAKTFGEQKAKRRLLWNVIRFFRPGILLRNQSNNIVPMILLQNNLKMAFRTMQKNKLFSAINVFGLSASMMACLLIFQYALFELSYDKQFSRSIYRVGSVVAENGTEKNRSAITSLQVGQILKEKLPEIAEAARLSSTSSWFDCTLASTEHGEQKIFNEKKGFYFADPAIIALLQLNFLEGNKTTALQKPFSIVLSYTVAKKYFGSENAIGKTMKLHGSFQTHDYTVTGVMKDFPINSHLDIAILASINSIGDGLDALTYVQLAPGADVRQVEERMNALASEYIPANNKTETHLMLESISSIHLHSQLQDQPKSTGSATTVYFLLLVGIVVLIMAWINYFNLTASRSIQRAKEIGIRKVTGASRASIAWQFLTESLVMHTISFILAIIFFNLITPIFYRWIGLPHIASFPLLGLITSAWIVGIIGLFLVGLFASGFFPIRYFAAVNPSKVLKGKWQAPRTKFPVRKVMLTFQFSCTVILAIVVLIFEQQFSFIKEQALGIDIKRSIVLTAPANVDSTYLQKLSSFKNQLKTKTIIHSVATSTDVPGNALGSGWGGNIMRSADDTGFGFGINVIDPDFIESYHLKLLAGRNFTTGDFPGTHFGDKLEPVIINRKGSEVLGFKSVEESIGQYIYWGLRKEASKCMVVGVIEEFHTESLKKSIQPMLYVANMGPSMTLKLTEGADKNLPAALAQIKEAWQQFFPSNAFDYFILEDRFNQQYEDDERVARLFNLFCLLAFSIAGVGLFGLSMYSLATRLKEISIRKVLGAPLTHLVLKLTSEYLLLIILASVIALPLTYFGIKEWLSGFAVKVELSVWHFIVPMIAVVIFALATVMIQTLKAAARNPVESLKND